MTDPVLQKALYGSGLFSWLDIHFARFIQRLCGNDLPEISLAAALLSRNQRTGHICLDLHTAGKGIVSDVLTAYGITFPQAEAWADKLIATKAAGRPGNDNPLVLDGDSRLYLHRYWEYQSVIAEQIGRRSGFVFHDLDVPRLAKGMSRMFDSPPSAASPAPAETNWQKVAAFVAVSRRFSVISGGPGTGKTTTVAKILALLLEQAAGARFRIALAAPTGKAAARLREAVVREKKRLESPSAKAVPEDVTTLHRLLGSLPRSPFFKYNAKNPLPFDVVVVDEASMVDVALMAKLIQAVSPSARLILLGDRDQLASVEAGAVLGDICDQGNVHRFSNAFCRAYDDTTGSDPACPSFFSNTDPSDTDVNDTGNVATGRTSVEGRPDDAPTLSDSIVILRKSYRFGDASGIGKLSRRINAGDGKNALAVMTSGKYPDVRWQTLPPAEELAETLKAPIVRGFGAYLAHLDDPAAAFETFDRFRMIAALRRGPFGVDRLNDIAEKILRGEDLIRHRSIWYPGRPVMITRNDYHQSLFNGDVGIALKDAAGSVRVCFPEAGGAFRFFSPFRLPPHETVYAMTVHKSQGSEFDHVTLILPDRDAPIMTRELLYTGITRAVRSIEIWAKDFLLIQAAGRPIQRTSGLRDALWKKGSSIGSKMTAQK